MANQALTDFSIKNSPKIGQVMGKNARGGIDKFSNKDQRALSAIPATDLSPVAPVNLPPAPVPQDPGDVIGSNNVGLATDGSLSLTGNQITPALTKASTEKDNLTTLFEQYMGSMEAPGSTADIYAQEAANAGLEEKRKTFNNLSSRLNSITANRDAEILKIEGENMQRGVTKGIFAGQASRIQREAAIQALPIQAQLAAAQGNLLMAENQVNTMFQIKSQDALAQYEFKGKVLDAVYEFATDQEKRRLDDVRAKEERTYAEQQDFLKTQQTLMSQALAQGAPSSVVSGINNAKTAQEAITAAGQYNGDLLAREAQRANIAQSYASIRASNASAAKDEYELEQLKDPALSTEQNADLAAYAMQFSDTGTLPSVSEMKQAGISASQVMDYAKQVPKPNGALVSTNTGTKSTTLSAEQEKSIAALNEIVTKTLPAMKDRFGKINTGVLGGLGGMVWTSQDRQDYLTFRQEFLNKLLVARSGGAVTEQEYSRYADMVPSTFNQAFFFGSDGSKKLNSIETSMKGNLDSVLNTNQLSMYGYSKVDVGGTQRTVGEVLDIGGTQYRVLPDGTLTDVI